jgi:hypothetical protein
LFTLFSPLPFFLSVPPGAAVAASEDALPFFSTVPRTMVTMLAMMTGNFDQTLFWDAQVPWLAVAMLVMYVLLMVVVLFNLLIAIMGNAFQRVSLSMPDLPGMMPYYVNPMQLVSASICST